MSESDDLAAAVESDSSLITFSHFRYCSCQQFGYPENHLEVQTTHLALDKGVAVAVSYAIGDFERQHHVIGHFQGYGRPASIELGSEWDITGVQRQLVTLSHDRTGIWLDQFSIDQTPEQIKLELQRIPRIYQALDVVVLLPIMPCRCLEESYEQFRSRESFIWQDGDFDLSKVARSCLNAIPISSWCFRLWTKQEFGYARSIRFAYCSTVLPQCTKGILEWEYALKDVKRVRPYLTAYLKYRFDEFGARSLSYGEHAADVMWSLFKQHIAQGRYAYEDHVLNFRLRDSDIDPIKIGSSNEECQAKVLLGNQFTRTAGEGEGRIMFGGNSLAQLATVKSDYVLAVFPEINGYQIPSQAKTLGLGELLEDGLAQYHRLMNNHLLSHLPQGLFELTPGSTRCRPNLYVDESKASSFSDIYGAVRGTSFRPITSFGHIMIRYRLESRGVHQSRLMRSATYPNAFKGSSTRDVFQFMRQVTKVTFGSVGRGATGSMEAWAQQILLHRNSIPSTWPSTELGESCFAEMLAITRDWDLPELDHETVCFNLMCKWASIQPDMARKLKLGVVVSRDDPPCIGFINGRLYDALESIERAKFEREAAGLPELSPHEQHRDNTLFAEDWLSVHVNPNLYYNERQLVYECMKASGSVSFNPAWINEPTREQPVPTYMAVGVWFTSAAGDESVGAEVCNSWEDCHAVIM